MTPEEIRARADATTTRVLDDGQINALHVAVEQTLREQHGHPSYIADLDGPGRFRPEQAPHTVEVELDEDGDVRALGFACTAPEGSLCRSWCTVCEETCSATPILGPVEQVAQAPVDGHPYEPVASCRVVDYLDAADWPEDVHAEDEPLRPGVHPIEEEWDGDTYLWRYADPEPEHPGHP